MPVPFSEIEFAYEYVSYEGGGYNSAVVHRGTGEVFCQSGLGDSDEIPEEHEDSDELIPVPDQRDLDLGSRLVRRFADEHMPDDSHRVRDIFSCRGAYGRFKDLLEKRGRLQDWYAYEERHTRQALLDWCERRGIEATDIPPLRNSGGSAT